MGAGDEVYEQPDISSDDATRSVANRVLCPFLINIGSPLWLYLFIFLDDMVEVMRE
jgi:hypothetical protein